MAETLRGATDMAVAVRTGSDSGKLGSWLELPRPDRLHRVALRPLSLGALHTVVSERVGRSFPRPKMHEIHQVSGGNPFDAVELARAIDDGAWDDRASLPGSLAELVRARIDSLTVGARTALLAAACLADPTVEVAARATGTGTDEVVTSPRRPRTRTSSESRGRHRLYFTHPLLVRGVYGESAPADRRRMHRQLAEILDEPELRARHLAMAAASGDPFTLRSLDSAVTPGASNSFCGKSFRSR